MFPNWIKCKEEKPKPTSNLIKVHKLSKDPTAAWKEIEKDQTVLKYDLEPLSQNIEPNKVRFVCMSDTHSKQSRFKFEIPEGDVFIHAGDFTNLGQEHEIIKFNDWLGSLPHIHKIVIAGNHELSFDENCIRKSREEVNCKDVKKLLTNCTYLEDSGVNIYGIKIYGSPWQPVFRDWAFNLNRGEAILEKWNLIPSDTDILITHGPPLGHGDLCQFGIRAGCTELLTTLQKRVHPKYHIFGHIHEGYGVTTDGTTIFINASNCDVNYFPINPPIAFDVSLPEGQQK